GFVCELQRFGERRFNLVAWLEGDGHGKPLGFTGHLDTVPLGNAIWSHSPFAGEIVDGRLYGRGSSDMKAGIAAFIVACQR
ncbi:peptidase M20, partial [Pseudomonas syringae pv. syringae FF5]